MQLKTQIYNQLLVSCLLLLFSKDTCDIVIAMFKALPIMLLKIKSSSDITKDFNFVESPGTFKDRPYITFDVHQIAVKANKKKIQIDA